MDSQKVFLFFPPMYMTGDQRNVTSQTRAYLLRYSGISSSQLSMMKTLRTYNLMLFFFFLFSNKSKGARLGTNRSALNSSCPSTEKCCKKVSQGLRIFKVSLMHFTVFGRHSWPLHLAEAMTSKRHF